MTPIRPLIAAGTGSTSVPPRPRRPAPPNISAIPQELKDRRQWILWRYEWERTKYTKRPYRTRRVGGKWKWAKSSDPSTWGTFDEAWAAYQSGDHFDGIGYVFSEDDPYFGADFDNCLEGRKLRDWAKPHVAEMKGTYGEVSPSGNGIKFLARGKLSGGHGTRRAGFGPDGKGAIEVYDRGQYFALTGDVWEETEGGIADKPGIADKLHATCKGRPEKEETRPPMGRGRRPLLAVVEPPVDGPHDDADVIRVASRLRGFDALYGGSTAGYKTASEAHMALMERFAYVCGPGREDQVIRLFLGSQLADHEKSDRPNYLKATATAAYKGKIKFFDWHQSSNGRAKGKDKPKAKGGGLQPANFTALITRMIVRIDAGGERVRYVIEAAHESGHQRAIIVESDKFASLSWAYALGPEFAVDPGRDTKDLFRHAVQIQSHAAGIKKVVEYTSMGWAKHDGADIYCHAGGVIASGPVKGVEVVLPSQLATYRLPAPTEDRETLVRCFEAHLRIGRLGTNLKPGARAARVFVAMLPWRAVLQPFNTTIHLGGPSGNYKTSAAQLAVQHFSGMIKGRICSPIASWRDTDNAILGLLYHAKDCITLVDDLKEDTDRPKAERVLQSVGDLKGRGRMSRDQQLMEGQSPRGAVISTGEIDPCTTSTLGRTLAAEVMLGDLTSVDLAACQQDADAGLYAQLMANYIRHVAGDRDAILADHARLAAKHREKIGEIPGSHPRHVEAIADLLAAYQLFLRWATKLGLIGHAEAETQFASIWADLYELGKAQSPRQQEAKPGRKFLELLASALASGRCHLTSVQSGVEPAERQEASGWHWEPDIKNPAEGRWRPGPGSKRIGWIEEKKGVVWLDPVESKLVATEMLRSERNPQSFASIGRELLQEKLIDPGGEGRPDQKVKIRGTQTRCYCIGIDHLFPR
jgi:hypothetical protein